MEPEKSDRRVKRTRQLLRAALIQLIAEKGYDAVTIQDITERANLGRTTFYLHYQSKDDLFYDHHAGMTNGLFLGTYTRSEFLSDQPLELVVILLEQIQSNRPLYFKISGAKDVASLFEGLRQQMAANLEVSLRDAFPDADPAYDFRLLAQYIAGAQISFVTWWLENRTVYSAGDIAQMLHLLQRAAVHAALGDLPADLD